MSRPAHATIVAYLALFIAIATGGAWAATQIKSSKQIKNGAVKGVDVKDENLSSADIGADSISGSEIRSGAVGAEELGDGSVGSAEVAPDAIGSQAIADGGVGTSEIADGSVDSADITPGAISGTQVAANSLAGTAITNRSLGGIEIALNALGTAEIAEDSLGLADVDFDVDQVTSPAIDNGGAFDAPRSPQGDLLEVDVATGGRYLLIAHSSLGGDDFGASVLCELDPGPGNPMDTGAFVSGADYGSVDHTPTSVSASMVVSAAGPFTATFRCADADTGAQAYERSLAAISLTG